MENFKLNIEVGFNAETLQVLSRLADALKGNTTTTAVAEPSQPAAPARPTPTPEPEKKVVMGANPIGTGSEDDDDLPPNDAPDPAPKPAKNPTEADARAAVKEARDRGVSPKAIKDYMKTAFGIAASVECPEERRAELIEGLKRLAA